MLKAIFEGVVFATALATICLILVFIAATDDVMWQSVIR
tara:strand:- start:113 stop:229 length:117 start_codon:yes stop_codon:yes gene_type:complete